MLTNVILTDYLYVRFNKIALKYKVNDFALWVNGVKVVQITTLQYLLKIT